MRVNIARTSCDLGFIDSLRLWLRLVLPVWPPEAEHDGGEDDQRDVAVDVEERDIETREITRAHQRVLVSEERDDRQPAHPIDRAETNLPTEHRQREGGQ